MDILYIIEKTLKIAIPVELKNLITEYLPTYCDYCEETTEELLTISIEEVNQYVCDACVCYIEPETAWLRPPGPIPHPTQLKTPKLATFPTFSSLHYSRLGALQREFLCLH